MKKVSSLEIIEMNVEKEVSEGNAEVIEERKVCKKVLGLKVGSGARKLTNLSREPSKVSRAVKVVRVLKEVSEESIFLVATSTLNQGTWDMYSTLVTIPVDMVLTGVEMEGKITPVTTDLWK